MEEPRALSSGWEKTLVDRGRRRKFWYEITGRRDIGADLDCPQPDERGALLGRAPEQAMFWPKVKSPNPFGFLACLAASSESFWRTRIGHRRLSRSKARSEKCIKTRHENLCRTARSNQRSMLKQQVNLDC